MIPKLRFPEFVKDKGVQIPQNFAALFYHRAVTYQDYAKLLIWSFVAGYSERFVLDAIDSITNYPKRR